jgi:hypothetical protein
MVFGETQGGCGRIARSGLIAREDVRSQHPAGIAKKRQPPRGRGIRRPHPRQCLRALGRAPWAPRQ